MAAEQDEYDALRNAAAVTAVCSTRIYPDVIPQEKALPAVAYVRAGTEFVTTIHTGTPQRTRATVEVWCHAETRSAADSLAVLVQTALTAELFYPTDRRAEMDSSGPLNVFATVLTYQLWE